MQKLSKQLHYEDIKDSIRERNYLQNSALHTSISTSYNHHHIFKATSMITHEHAVCLIFVHFSTSAVAESRRHHWPMRSRRESWVFYLHSAHSWTLFCTFPLCLFSSSTDKNARWAMGRQLCHAWGSVCRVKQGGRRRPVYF